MNKRNAVLVLIQWTSDQGFKQNDVFLIEGLFRLACRLPQFIRSAKCGGWAWDSATLCTWPMF